MGKKNRKNNKESQSNKTSITIIGVVVLAIIVLMSSLIFLQEKNKSDATQDLEDMYSELSTIGDKSAPVHIVEFGDYKCPFCKEFNEGTLPYIVQNYVTTGKAQLHFANYSFLGSDSPYIAEFTETVRQELGEEQFWLFHDMVYANQEEESKVWGTEERLTDLLSEIVTNKEDVSKVVNAVKEGKYKEKIEKQNQLANNLQINSTPSILVNGEVLNFTSPESLFDAINKAIAESE